VSTGFAAGIITYLMLLHASRVRHASLSGTDQFDVAEVYRFGRTGKVAMRTVRTELLEISFEEGGPRDGAAVLLLHGWPDAPCGWDLIASRLQAKGWRTVVPYLRGSGGTRFLWEERRGGLWCCAGAGCGSGERAGSGAVCGGRHDWGARRRIRLRRFSGASDGLRSGARATPQRARGGRSTVETVLVSVADVRGGGSGAGARGSGWVCACSGRRGVRGVVERRSLRGTAGFLNPDCRDRFECVSIAMA
jgi:hypothetical protein